MQAREDKEAQTRASEGNYTEDVAMETDTTASTEGTAAICGVEIQASSIRSGILEEHHLMSVSTQTDLSSAMVRSMGEGLNRLLVKNGQLKADAENSKFNEKWCIPDS